MEALAEVKMASHDSGNQSQHTCNLDNIQPPQTNKHDLVSRAQFDLEFDVPFHLLHLSNILHTTVDLAS